MKEKVAFLFPGQGAQYKGMCSDLYAEYPVVRRVFEQISDISHHDIKKMCFESSDVELRQPDKASLSTFTHSISIARVLETQLGYDLNEIGNSIVGHSMGQYSALCCVKSISLKDSVEILMARSSYTMQATQKNTSAGMVCVAGLQEWQVQDMIDSAHDKGFAAIANRNLRDQFVISGENSVLDEVLDLAKVKGAKIAKRLAVSIPAHCILMQSAADLMAERLKTVTVNAPNMNWFSNETANVMSNPNDIKEALVKQMIHGVNWVGIMERFPEYNITMAYELGPGKVLSGLVKRGNVGCVAKNTDKLPGVQLMCEELEKMMVNSR